MSFHESLNEAYQDGFLMAIQNDCQLRAYRVDREEHNEDVNGQDPGWHSTVTRSGCRFHNESSRRLLRGWFRVGSGANRDLDL